jgi:hypothetical protein
VGFAYANSDGEFTFERNSIFPGQTVYAVVNIEGFKPYRERLFFADFVGSFLTIFLERESTVTVSVKDRPVVDLKQLRAKIPGKAMNEYEKRPGIGCRRTECAADAGQCLYEIRPV